MFSNPERWPDFFVIGAPRSGTTFFYYLLRSVPGVFVCPLKEPNYFATTINTKRKLNKPIRSRKAYLRLFRDAGPNDILCETSPTYLWDPAAAKNIYAVSPGAKILALLRDPAHRAYSHYLMGLGIGNESKPFIPAMRDAMLRPDDYSGRIARAGFYAEQIERYMRKFPEGQLKILIHEEFVQDEMATARTVLEFLGIAYELDESIPRVTNTFDLPVGSVSKYLVRNPACRWVVRELFPRQAARSLRRLFGKKVEKPKMTREEWEFAAELYREDVTRVERILGRKLPWLEKPEELER